MLHLPLKAQLPILAALFLLACDKDRHNKRAADDTAPTHDTGPAPDTDPACDAGYIDDDGECVPIACGTGTWGNLEVDESTVYVDINAAEGGDGSEVAPFTSIQAGLDAAGDAGGGMVAVAAGSYPETLDLGRPHDGVHLAGRCRELVVIDASVGDESTAGIDVDAETGEVELSGVTVQGARYYGVLVGSGTLTIRDSAVVCCEYDGVAAYQHGSLPTMLTMEACEVRGNTAVGVGAFDPGTSVTLRRTTIEETQPDEDGEYGYGIYLASGASLDAEGCEVRENTRAGVILLDPGTSAALRETTIEETQPREDGGSGYGIYLFYGASLDAQGCVVRGNTNAGVVLLDPDTSVALRETIIEDTKPHESGSYGYGIYASDSASLHAEGCVIGRSNTTGVRAFDAGTSITLRSTTIEDTQPTENVEYGYGIHIHDGASLDAQACELRRNTSAGVFAFDPGTSVTLRATAIEDTQPDTFGKFGYGIYLSSGASLDAQDCQLGANTILGLSAADFGTTVSLRETTIENTKPRADGAPGSGGIYVTGEASLDMDGCAIRANTGMGLYASGSGTSVALRTTTIEDSMPHADGDFGYGIQVSTGASLDMEGCEVRGCTALGVAASDPGTIVALRDSRIVSTMHGEIYTVGIGIGASRYASIVATAIEVSSNEGPGFYLVHEDTQLGCSGCEVWDNQFAGAAVVNGASLELVGSFIGGTSVEENIGGGVGIYAEPWDGVPPSLTVSDCTIQDNPIAGIWLSGGGRFSFADNTIHGGEGWTRENLTKCGDAVYAGDGVTVWDGSSGLLLENNELLDGLGAGLFLDDASATLSGNNYADNAVDLVVQGLDCAIPLDGYQGEELGSAELCPEYDYATCGDEFMLYMTLAEPESGYGAAFMRPGLPGPGELHVPTLPIAIPHTFDPLPLLPPAPRLEPLRLRLQPLRHEPALLVPYFAPRGH